jgi:hypothetical protein
LSTCSSVGTPWRFMDSREPPRASTYE